MLTPSISPRAGLALPRQCFVNCRHCDRLFNQAGIVREFPLDLRFKGVLSLLYTERDDAIAAFPITFSISSSPARCTTGMTGPDAPDRKLKARA